MVPCCIQARKRRMKVMRIIHLPLSSLPGKDSSDLLICKEPGEFGSLLLDHPVVNSVAKVQKQLNTFRMLRGYEQCDSLLLEGRKHGVLCCPDNHSCLGPVH